MKMDSQNQFKKAKMITIILYLQALVATFGCKEFAFLASIIETAKIHNRRRY